VYLREAKYTKTQSLLEKVREFIPGTQAMTQKEVWK